MGAIADSFSAGASIGAKARSAKEDRELKEKLLTAAQGSGSTPNRGAVDNFVEKRAKNADPANQTKTPWDSLFSSGKQGTGMAGLADGGSISAMPPGMMGEDPMMSGAPVAEGPGPVSGPGGPRDDAIPARLSDGEYIIPADVVARKGTEFFDRLVEKVQAEIADRESGAQVTPTGTAIPPGVE